MKSGSELNNVVIEGRFFLNECLQTILDVENSTKKYCSKYLSILTQKPSLSSSKTTKRYSISTTYFFTQLL
jgi:hypothetical protein